MWIMTLCTVVELVSSLS